VYFVHTTKRVLASSRWVVRQLQQFFYLSNIREGKGESLAVPPRLSESKHFQIERLADGVYAAVASE